MRIPIIDIDIDTSDPLVIFVILFIVFAIAYYGGWKKWTKEQFNHKQP